MKIKAHRLYRDDGSKISYVRSPNQSSGTIKPRFLVMHYTAGASASSSVSWLTNRDAKASAHLVIGRDGSITQLVDFNRKAWHAGRSAWRGIQGLNSHSIGIELDNPGILKGAHGSWRTSWGRPVPDTEVFILSDGFGNSSVGWHTYTEIQLEVAREVSLALVRHYDIEEVVGHEDIAPGRKKDPGPAFPMTAFQSLIIGRDSDEAEEVFETTTDLNIRKGPGTEFEKFDEVSPLPKGTRLSILESQGLWRKVDVLDIVNNEMDIVGWVHGRYIDRK
ncbi:N-acetylmuramoyl-L-alanine amidase [uncultured Desulfobacter sp.]|uniref:N-acetylmuramoyl-L-alanine amidase n=1 Tax=uncultured Desulfobacter sp. TaxID=240139 RepID=UPI0029F5AC5E|nr:N-acetylmuramoyl-L-alanine amidase [uncultured Desulfobacter sp.]